MYRIEEENKIDDQEVYIQDDSEVLPKSSFLKKCKNLFKGCLPKENTHKFVSNKVKLSIDSGINECQTRTSASAIKQKKQSLNFFQFLFCCIITNNNDEEEECNLNKTETPKENILSVIENIIFDNKENDSLLNELKADNETSDDYSKRDSFISVQTSECTQKICDDGTNSFVENKNEDENSIEKLSISESMFFNSIEKLSISESIFSLKVEDKCLSSNNLALMNHTIVSHTDNESILKQDIYDNFIIQEFHKNEELEINQTSYFYKFVVVILFSMCIMTFKFYVNKV
ncbi:uncharacterized protein LOC136087238 [Hydra vulgaris]|uniref:Uncharacterized protein LOC136087238 n=1 Tax=Hydra vulgaris TaxID=6087 RepID=A0ABM4CV16_HYDVU